MSFTTIALAVAAIPIGALGLWKYRADYRRRGRQTALGLLGGIAALTTPHLVMGTAHPVPAWPETPLGYVGWALMLLGLGLCLAAMLNFRSGKRVLGMDTSGLTTTGLYRVSRNPQYAFYALFPLGYSLTGDSWTPFLGMALFCAAGHLMVLIEEQHLERVHGEEYRAYRRRTPRYLLV